MRLLTILILSGLLAIVYWLGVTDYSKRIERDITQRTQTELDTHRASIGDISHEVDGRDVDVYGTASSETHRMAAFKDVEDVWGVRVAHNNLALAEPVLVPEPEPEPEPEKQPESVDFDFSANYQYPELSMSGLVDEPAYQTATNIHRALPPETVLDDIGLEPGSSDLYKSPRKLETGIAALTQLNPGNLRITDKQFILEGDVASVDRERTVRELIETRRADLEPLEVIVSINVTPSAVSAECQKQLDDVLANNVLNYAVNHYQILGTHRAVLDDIVYTVQEPCNDYIDHVLVEGHADVTGSDGYNQGLSERRSDTAKDYLLDNGLETDKVQAFGYGEFRPIASNDTVAGRSKNRRTEIYLLLSDEVQTVGSVPKMTTFSED